MTILKSSKPQQKISLAIALVIILGQCLALPVVAKTLACKLLQKHYFLGRWEVLVNETGVQAHSLNDGYSIVTMAPSWKVVFFNAKLHIAYESSMSSWLKNGLHHTGGYVTDADPATGHPRPDTYNGIQTTVYSFRRGHGGPEKVAFALSDLPREAAVVLSRYWTSSQITNDQHICHFLQRLWGMPQTSGFPIAFKDEMADYRINAVLDTLDCKPVPISSFSLAYPKNFKACQSQNDVTVSQAKRKDLDEWAKSLGLGEHR